MKWQSDEEKQSWLDALSKGTSDSHKIFNEDDNENRKAIKQRFVDLVKSLGWNEDTINGALVLSTGTDSFYAEIGTELTDDELEDIPRHIEEASKDRYEGLTSEEVKAP